jgi:predicted nucleotidyltransferase
MGEIGHNRGMRLEELRQSNKEQILRLAASYGARNIRIFGSVARGDSSPLSDIDFLVDLDPDRTLMHLGGLLTGLVMYNTISFPMDPGCFTSHPKGT